MVESWDFRAKRLKRNRKKVLEDIIGVITSGKYRGYPITVSDKYDFGIYGLIGYAEGTVILRDYTEKYNIIRLWAIGLDEKSRSSLFRDLEKAIKPYLTEKERITRKLNKKCAELDSDFLVNF